MLTPGAAGALMMLIANSVCRVFPEVEFRYAALALSFAIGLLVFKAIAIGLGEKAFYWVLNSLIIFATGVGASNIGANLESSKLNSSHLGSSYALFCLKKNSDTAQRH